MLPLIYNIILLLEGISISVSSFLSFSFILTSSYTLTLSLSSMCHLFLASSFRQSLCLFSTLFLFLALSSPFSFQPCFSLSMYLVSRGFLLYVATHSSPMPSACLPTLADFTYLKDSSVKYLSKGASRFDVWRGNLVFRINACERLRGGKRAIPCPSPPKGAINSRAASRVHNTLRCTADASVYSQRMRQRRSMRKRCCLRVGEAACRRAIGAPGMIL